MRAVFVQDDLQRQPESEYPTLKFGRQKPAGVILAAVFRSWLAFGSKRRGTPAETVVRCAARNAVVIAAIIYELHANEKRVGAS